MEEVNQLRNIISTNVNVTMYPLYNYNMLIIKKKKIGSSSLRPVIARCDE
jgi:hypothetical protein